MTPNFLTLAEILEIHRDQIVRYGGGLELRDAGLLEAARAMPEQSFDGQFLHRDLPAMAAAYLYHLVKNHPFVDGNKRAGAATAVVFLHLNDLRLNCTQDEYYNLTLGVADSSISKDEAAEFFRRHVVPAGDAQ
ncbi:type II toxin-antitoxin system death-on-curing family toxin [Planctellipticum variicoloris]|uniref:type II toxin-antitoxin system death-on-curing family toxin n=1 Tax=Planctellipticum variicoloris TaxID=3064265 RepID=UPI002BC67BB7|nr:type II toxin-antitoxin system death-on-curing family toxin [Planctomycetaceae bacterium SH412]HTN03947.1 type II toxin-antitoxin system death-on-curing family toxin [Planctomycetaceae bacterium]